jgi:hypothetical protein
VSRVPKAEEITTTELTDIKDRVEAEPMWER